jgi:hypothetical protein
LAAVFWVAYFVSLSKFLTFLFGASASFVPYHLLFLSATLMIGNGVVTWFAFRHHAAASIGGPTLVIRRICGVSLAAGTVLAFAPGRMIHLKGFGTVIAAFAALMFWMALGTQMRWRLTQLRDSEPLMAQLFVALILVMTVSFVLGMLPSRDVRELAAVASPSGVTARPALADHVQQWLASRRDKIRNDSPYPVVLVASWGGGIRAAYWAAGILSALEDKAFEGADDRFAHHVLALSGVSGGSIGTAVFVALSKLPCRPEPGRSLVTPAGAQSTCRSRADAILRRDFLAPVLYSMLTRDVLTSLLKTAWPPDRAIALEQAFEDSWASTVGNDWFSQPQEALWDGSDAYRVPVAFFNVTESVSAGRVVVGPVSLVGGKGIDDQNQKIIESRRLRLSTAATLSARFPYVSPVGRVEGTADGKKRILGLVDGGFFDNSGTATVANVLDALGVVAAKEQVADKIAPVVLVIRNDPLQEREPTASIGGLGAPLALLDKYRAERSVEFTKALCERMRGYQNGAIVESIRPASAEVEFPLGWTLSEKTRGVMADQLNAIGRNGPLAELFRILAGEKSDTSAPLYQGCGAG